MAAPVCCSAGRCRWFPMTPMACAGRWLKRVVTAKLLSGPFEWLPAHEPVAVRRGYDNLAHSVVGIFGR
jgi:hypothetical protein